jgi:HPt (histidine-containing phosphotransfer) domain-containing protein
MVESLPGILDAGQQVRVNVESRFSVENFVLTWKAKPLSLDANMAENGNLVDWEQMDMMADGYSPEFILIYYEFIDQLPELLDALDAFIAANNLSGVREVAHKIKGSAANFGFVGVSAPMAAIEIVAKERHALEGAGEKSSAARSNFKKSQAEVLAKRGV